MARLISSLALVACLVTPTIANEQSGHGVAFFGADWVGGGGPSAGFYHAFLCISTRLNAGLKEDCYGFYPENTNKAAVGGPGKIGQSDIKRIDGQTVSTGYVDIDAGQRSQIFKMMAEWKEKGYQLNYSNCIDFVDSVAAFVKLKRPARSATQKPAEYVAELKRLNGI
jgi:hypothetical protein